VRSAPAWRNNSERDCPGHSELSATARRTRAER
jgi:hypothetical protein